MIRAFSLILIELLLQDVSSPSIALLWFIWILISLVAWITPRPIRIYASVLSDLGTYLDAWVFSIWLCIFFFRAILSFISSLRFLTHVIMLSVLLHCSIKSDVLFKDLSYSWWFLHRNVKWYQVLPSLFVDHWLVSKYRLILTFSFVVKLNH